MTASTHHAHSSLIMNPPVISPEVQALRPDFAALSIVVDGARNLPSDPFCSEKLHMASTQGAPAWGQEHLESWREAYRAFGAKPQRTPSSAEALRKRVQRDGSLPPINAIVDLYNAISLQFSLPVGGEDAAAYVGTPRLVIASGDEPFDTTQNGAPATEIVEAGEVIWRDDVGATCRRWNWRQGIRTRITEDSTRMWFILERLDPMSMTALAQAGEELLEGLRRLSPALVATTQLIGRTS